MAVRSERLAPTRRRMLQFGVPGSLVGDGVAMRHSLRATRPASTSQERPARARFWSSRVAEAGAFPVVELLGAVYPMVRVTVAIAVAERPACAVGVVLVASVAAANGSVAIAVVASAAVVAVVLVAIVATFLDQRRRLAVDLIAEGREA